MAGPPASIWDYEVTMGTESIHNEPPKAKEPGVFDATETLHPLFKVKDK